MSIHMNVQDRIGKMYIEGKFDFGTHREFKDAYTAILEDPSIHEIEVNLHRTDFIDSAALGMLMLLRERALLANKEITLSCPSPVAFKLLWIANFDKIFTIKN